MSEIISTEAHRRAMEIIKKFEGLRLEAYQDVVGVWTIGWGTTVYPDGSRVKRGDRITEDYAEECLAHDMLKFENGIAGHIPYQLNPNQNAALISFAYNLGLGALYHSTLLKKIHDKDLEGAANEFKKWCHAGGKKVNGLVRRRKDERNLFLEA